MKQLFFGLTAVFAFGTAFAQTTAPTASAVTAPAAQPAQDQDPAAALPAQSDAVFVETAQVPTTPVVNTAAKVSPAVISAGAAAALLAVAFTAGDSDDDRPSSP